MLIVVSSDGIALGRSIFWQLAVYSSGKWIPNHVKKAEWCALSREFARHFRDNCFTEHRDFREGEDSRTWLDCRSDEIEPSLMCSSVSNKILALLSPFNQDLCTRLLAFELKKNETWWTILFRILHKTAPSINWCISNFLFCVWFKDNLEQKRK